MGQVTGVVRITINGTTQRSEIGATLDFGGKARTAQTGYKVYGYTEKIQPSKLKFTIFHLSDTDLLALKDTVGATASFICDTGPVYPVTNAFVTNPLTLKGGDGKVEIEMEGDPVDTKQ